MKGPQLKIRRLLFILLLYQMCRSQRVFLITITHNEDKDNPFPTRAETVSILFESEVELIDGVVKVNAAYADLTA
ncbi:hypothetical protein BGX29_000257 [Mortierella sp. GBA35]|nr:hypothetical protein BGX29_000257 [Mortierella sp. GBA35]